MSWFASTSHRAQRQTATVEATYKEHGRLDHYRLRATTALNDYLAAEYGWPEVAQALCIERTSVCLSSGEVTRTSHYAITSLPDTSETPARMLEHWRRHWHIENKSHWVRDVVFGEDAARTRTGQLPEVLALLRALVISRMRLAGMEAITTARTQLSARLADALFLVGVPLE